MKLLTSLIVVFFAFNALAVSRIQVLEDASHKIIHLAQNGEIPLEVMTKLHLLTVNTTASEFRVLAVLDHNEDHSQPVAHLRLVYDQDGQYVSHRYVPGYLNPAPTSFTEVSTARLFDLAIELISEGQEPDLLSYSQGVTAIHLGFLAPSNQALFHMLDESRKKLELITDLNGNYVSHRFLP